MMKKTRKIKLLAATALLITLAAPQAQAFPLLCSDPSRLVASMRVTMQDVMIIKQEVESNLQIVKLIANGGFAQAGAAIFGKIQNGDYDRFGNALKDVKSNTQDMTNNVKEREERAKREKELRAKGMSEKLAKEQARQESAERLQKAQAERAQKALEAKQNRGSDVFSSSYDWLKDNQSFTSGAQSALSGVSNGNWGSVVSGAATAAGGAINSGGESTLGNIFNGSANSAGNTLNSALNGNWGGAFNSAVGTAGTAIGGAVGSEGTGNTIGALGNIGEGVYDVIGSDGNLGEKIIDTINNGQIQSGLSGVESGYNQSQAEIEAANKAQAEADKKAAEEIKQNLDKISSQLDKQFKQEECQRCKDNNKAAGRDEMNGCLAACTSN